MSQQELKVRLFIWDQVFRLLRWIVVGAVVVFCVGAFYLSVEAVAGKTTELNGTLKGGLNLVVNKHLAEILLSVVTLLTGKGYLTERKKRIRAEKRLPSKGPRGD